MECRDVLDRLSPFVDDELDPVASREISQHLKSCPSCTAALARQRELGESLRRDLEYHRAPDLLRARVMREVRGAERREVAPSRFPALPWRWLSAAAAVAAVVGGTWMVATLPRDRGDEATAREAVSGHIRSLMANHLTDVASTDQHTVKPWFSGKLDFSPEVKDLANEGFTLVGGRLDYLTNRPVAALVYQRRQHVINLFIWRAAPGENAEQKTLTRQGYTVIHWNKSGMAYWAVSDLNPRELQEFVKLMQ